jgi:hypothetical protein
MITNNTQQLTKDKAMAKKPMSKMAPKFTSCKECPPTHRDFIATALGATVVLPAILL